MIVKIEIRIDDIGENNNPIKFMENLIQKALKDDEDFSGKILKVAEVKK